MIPFKTAYERSTTTTHRASKRAQTKFSHVSLVYEQQKEWQGKSKKDIAPKGQVTRTLTKKLSPEERFKKLMKTKHGRRALALMAGGPTGS